MLNFEHFVKLGTIALLGVFFVSISAVADKKESSEKTSNPIPQLKLIQEAELINSGGLHVSQLTRIGISIESTSSSAAQ